MPLFCHEFKKRANKPKPQKLCLSWTPRMLIPNPYPETAVGLWLMWSNGLKMSVFLSNWSPDKFWTDILSVLQDRIDRDNRKKTPVFYPCSLNGVPQSHLELNKRNLYEACCWFIDFRAHQHYLSQLLQYFGLQSAISVLVN